MVIRELIGPKDGGNVALVLALLFFQSSLGKLHQFGQGCVAQLGQVKLRAGMSRGGSRASITANRD